MDLPSFQSGLGTVWADLRDFLAGVRFARPGLLWLSLLPAAVAVLAIVAEWRKRRAIAAFGRPAAVAGLTTMRPSRQWLARFLLGLGWAALVLAVAGPKWGTGADDGAAVGRDMVVVIDLSRSMQATDLSTPDPRWRAAIDGVRGLIDACRNRGGHRIGIVVFAARPVLFVPLTTDLTHLELQLLDLDGERPPHDVRPLDDSVRSGTRIGAALKLAVAAHDPRFTGAQDVILFTDADDPEPDSEWASGVTAARNAAIPVHVVGIGNPDANAPFTLHLKARGEEVIDTWLREEVAKEIAAEGRGAYLPARRDTPDMAAFFRTRIEPLPPRLLDDDPTSQLQDRSVWFYLAAAVLLGLGWVRER
ncbi:MAG: VWA domain-containing protein [Fimbriiglobus sp.]|nr:VWA domain-containing protein [Fimbriiglobus sp.]